MPGSAFTTGTAAIGSSTMPPFIVTASEAAVIPLFPRLRLRLSLFPDCDDKITKYLGLFVTENFAFLLRKMCQSQVQPLDALSGHRKLKV